jgi:hypothetical protein
MLSGHRRIQRRRSNATWLLTLGMYHRKRALCFQTEDDLNKALQALWDPTDALYRVPRAPGDALTMIVPADALPLFRARGFKFVEYAVAPATRGSTGGSNVA